MKKEQKIELVKGLLVEMDNISGVILTNYKGLTFTQMDSIRRTIKSSGNGYQVIKNTLLKKAFDAKNINLDSMLAEPTACIIVKNDFPAVAKQVKKFANDPAIGKFFVIKGGYFDGMVLDTANVKTIADLPSREELLARALRSMNAPVTNFVSLLANIPRSFLNVLNAIKDKK